MELAPWMGGFYERMVGLVKVSLKKVLNIKVVLTVMQLCTLLSEVQSVINSRPLTYVGDDVNSAISLSPAHFLTSNPQIGIPEIHEKYDTEDDPDYVVGLRQNSGQKLLSIWKKGQKLLNHFWDIWGADYLLSLRERTKTHIRQGRVKASEFPNIGDVVLIKEDLPHGTWRMGEIQKLIPSDDGEIRTAQVLLPSKKLLKRRINLLYPIECSMNEKSSDEEEQHSDTETEVKIEDRRPTRQAAIKARMLIKESADRNDT